MDYATLAQGANVLKMISDKKLTVERLQQLLATGILSDIIGAESPLNVNRNDLRAVLGMPTEDIFELSMTAGTTIKSLRAANEYMFHESITDDRFPFSVESDKTIYVEVINLGRICSINDALLAGDAQGLKILTYAEAICFAAAQASPQSRAPSLMAFTHLPVQERIIGFERDSFGLGRIGTFFTSMTGQAQYWAFERPAESYRWLRERNRIRTS